MSNNAEGSPPLSLKDRMAALKKASGSEDPSLSQPTAAAQASGTKLHAGWLRKSGTGIMAAASFSRYCVLSVDPALFCLYEDEAQTRAKGVLQLIGATISIASSTQILIGVTEGKPVTHKFTAASESVAAAWQEALQKAVGVPEEAMTAASKMHASLEQTSPSSQWLESQVRNCVRTAGNLAQLETCWLIAMLNLRHT